jgi:hypothetical protein
VSFDDRVAEPGPGPRTGPFLSFLSSCTAPFPGLTHPAASVIFVAPRDPRSMGRDRLTEVRKSDKFAVCYAAHR